MLYAWMQVYGNSFFSEWDIILGDYSGQKQPETKSDF